MVFTEYNDTIAWIICLCFHYHAWPTDEMRNHKNAGNLSPLYKIVCIEHVSFIEPMNWTCNKRVWLLSKQIITDKWHQYSIFLVLCIISIKLIIILSLSLSNLLINWYTMKMGILMEQPFIFIKRSPYFVILLRGCGHDVVVRSYAVGFIYITGKLSFVTLTTVSCDVHN